MSNQVGRTFCQAITQTVRLDYLLHLPNDYQEGADARWPLIVFLHGSEEGGDDLDLVKTHGVPKIVEQKDDFPFVVVSPQCPSNSFWIGYSAHHTSQVDSLKPLLEHVLTTYSADPDRVYLTGLSNGGAATWALAARHPEMFAAIAPVCGYGHPLMRYSLQDMPTWVFHGAKDSVVPPERSKELVTALREVGNEPRFTLYDDLEHDCWTETYVNPKLYEWFLSHSRSPK